MHGKHLWFKAKNFGWGWYPVTWQGWLVLAVYLLNMYYRFEFLKPEVVSGIQVGIRFLFDVAIPTLALLFICYLTGEKPEWRWGRK